MDFSGARFALSLCYIGDKGAYRKSLRFLIFALNQKLDIASKRAENETEATKTLKAIWQKSKSPHLYTYVFNCVQCAEKVMPSVKRGKPKFIKHYSADKLWIDVHRAKNLLESFVLWKKVYNCILNNSAILTIDFEVNKATK